MDILSNTNSCYISDILWQYFTSRDPNHPMQIQWKNRRTQAKSKQQQNKGANEKYFMKHKKGKYEGWKTIELIMEKKKIK